MGTCICLKLVQTGTSTNQRHFEFFVDRKDAENLAAHIIGYGKFGNTAIEFREEKPSSAMHAPSYDGLHFVSPAGWNYSCVVDQNTDQVVNLACGPPTFEQATVSTNQYNTIPVISGEFSLFNEANERMR